MTDIKKRNRAPKQLAPADVWPHIEKWELEDRIKLRAVLNDNIAAEIKSMEVAAADLQAKVGQFKDALK
jgi:hypothetical protein